MRKNEANGANNFEGDRTPNLRAEKNRRAQQKGARTMTYWKAFFDKKPEGIPLEEIGFTEERTDYTPMGIRTGLTMRAYVARNCSVRFLPEAGAMEIGAGKGSLRFAITADDVTVLKRDDDEGWFKVGTVITDPEQFETLRQIDGAKQGKK